MMIGSTNALQPHGRKAHAPAAAPALRVLIVEDDAAVAEALADMVTDLGHRVVATERSRDAIDTQFLAQYTNSLTFNHQAHSATACEGILTLVQNRILSALKVILAGQLASHAGDVS